MMTINLLHRELLREKMRKKRKRIRAILLGTFIVAGIALTAVVWTTYFSLLLKQKKIETSHEVGKTEIHILVPKSMVFEDCEMINNYISQGHKVIVEMK